MPPKTSASNSSSMRKEFSKGSSLSRNKSSVKSGLVNSSIAQNVLLNDGLSSQTGISSSENRERERGKWLTMQMVQYQNREMYLEITLRGVIFYFIFLILLTTVTFGVLDSRMYFLTKTFVDLLITKKFQTWNDEVITFLEITRVNDFWKYLDNVIIDSFHWEKYYNNILMTADSKLILYENKLIGVPRLRMARVRNNSCVIHRFFRDLFLDCYGDYAYSMEDRKKFPTELNGTGWKYTSATGTGSYPFMGKAATYYGGGYYQNLVTDRTENQFIIDELYDNMWITLGTRMVCMDFTVYNGNLNLFLSGKLIFEFPPTGGILPSYKFNTMKLIRYVSQMDYFITACEWLCACFIVYYTIEELRELAYYKMEYFKIFWNYMDVIILIMGYICILLQMGLVVESQTTLINNMHRETTYANFELISILYVNYVCALAVLLFLVHLKLFKYFSFNKRMSQLNNTLHKCALDIASFSLMFFIIFIAYAELGYLFFGSHIEGFSSLGASMYTLLRSILGDFNYMEIEEANRILAPIYFITYIFLVFFVLLNMFLAIINDTYSDIKTEMVVRSDEMQMSEYFLRGFYRFLDKCGCGQFVPKPKIKQAEYELTVTQVESALKKCGFLDYEIDDFFERYNIDPAGGLGEFDSNKLMSELQESFEKARYADYISGGERNRSTQTPESNFKFKSGGLITIEDFILHQEKLLKLENIIFLLTQRVELLIRRLENLDNVRKAYLDPQNKK